MKKFKNTIVTLLFTASILAVLSGCGISSDLSGPVNIPVLQNGFQTMANQVQSAPIVKFKGKSYFVQALVNGPQADIWFRIGQNYCTANDIRVATIGISKGKLKDATRLICSAKKVYDGGKTLVGCAASLTTAACLTAAAPTGETAAVICSATILYTINGGLGDCLNGVTDAIGGQLSTESQWQTYRVYAAIGTLQFRNAIDYALGAACTQVH